MPSCFEMEPRTASWIVRYGRIYRKSENWLMSVFEFETDDQSQLFCENIARQMVALFGISREEAIVRINRDWSGLKFLGKDDVIYHEDEIYWAKTFYFGKGSNWWLNPPDLQPRPL